jgi:hypothetical protein
MAKGPGFGKKDLNMILPSCCYGCCCAQHITTRIPCPSLSAFIWALIAVVFWLAGGGAWLTRIVGATGEVPISAALPTGKKAPALGKKT